MKPSYTVSEPDMFKNILLLELYKLCYYGLLLYSGVSDFQKSICSALAVSQVVLEYTEGEEKKFTVPQLGY